MKKMPKRQYTVLNAVLIYFLGRIASAATMLMYSGPTTVKACIQR